MIKKLKYISLIFLLTLVTLSQLNAQVTQEKYVKNRIQYHNFEWKYLSTDNFEIYFTEGGYPIAQLAAKYAELEYDRIVDLIDFAPYTKIKIILYKSHTDLLQSNIKTHEENPALGGQTEFIKSKIEVPFEGNQIEFKHRISAGIATYLVTDMMYGGSLRDIYRNSLFLTLPDWYISGLAAWVAKGWSQDMDDYLRDMFSHTKISNPSQVSPQNPTLIGQSIWHYIATKSGKNSISQILSLTRITRDFETAISHTTGFRYNKFQKEWRNYYRSNADATIDTYTIPDTKQALSKNRKQYNYFRVKHSPNGQLLAYSENYKGKYKVYVYDIKTGKRKRFLTGGYKSIDQEVNYNIPLLAWKSDKALSVIEIKKDKVQMTTKDITGGEKSTRIFGTFDQVLDFDYSDDGNNIVFSAEKDGQSDIYLFAIKSNTMKQVTNDLFDDEHPAFFKGSYNFVFSSNRTDDTLITRTLALTQLIDNADIFMYEPLVSTTKLRRITSTSYNEKFPVPLADNSIAYLQSKTGVYNLQIVDKEYKTSNQVTNFQQDIHHFDFSYDGKFSYIILHNGKELFFPNYQWDLKKNSFNPDLTPRKLELEAIQSTEILSNKSTPISLVIPTDTVATVPIVKDTAQQTVKTEEVAIDPNSEEFTFSSSQKPVIGNHVPINNHSTSSTPITIPIDEEEIDYSNYKFESEKNKTINTTVATDEGKNVQNSIIATKVKSEKTIKVSEYQLLQNKLSINNVLYSLIRDNLRGYGLVIESSISDMLENHKFEGNIYANFNLQTSTMSLAYEYLKHRFDYKFKYEKQRIIASDTATALFKNGMDKFEVSISYPFSPAAKLMFTGSGLGTSVTDLVYNSSTNDHKSYYSGARLEYVFDNTVPYGMNMQTGTKIRLLAENYWGIKEQNIGFNRLQLDLRKYTKVHKEIVLAGRFSAGTFGGASPKKYLLGGVDNWFFPKENNTSGENNPLQVGNTSDNRDWFFNQYATNLRGFQYNKVYGNSHILANLELRVPISKYIYKGVISSTFLRNLQIIGFYDVGTAWSNSNPFNEENSYNTSYISSGPYNAKIVNFKNPFLSSYGFGVRSFALGYYVKLDLALPVIDYVTQNPNLILSLGYDF